MMPSLWSESKLKEAIAVEGMPESELPGLRSGAASVGQLAKINPNDSRRAAIPIRNNMLFS
jgi:hypothetical protein